MRPEKLRALFYRVAPLSLPFFFGGGASCGGDPNAPLTWAVALPEGSSFAGPSAPIPTLADCKVLCEDATIESCTVEPGVRGQSVECVGVEIGTRTQAFHTSGAAQSSGCSNYSTSSSGCSGSSGCGSSQSWGTWGGGGGRRPPGLMDCQQPADGCALGGYFASCAHLEAASIAGFVILRRELRAHGAPRRLLQAASRAARDEVRHARTMAAFARRHRATPSRPRVVPHAVRTLEAIAIENAIEGCVAETYSALQAVYQAEAVQDRAMRAILSRIAEDETRHAALAFDVAAWLDQRLDPAARRRVAEARRAAVAKLRAELAVEPPLEVVAGAGVPRAAQAQALIAGLEATLWA